MVTIKPNPKPLCDRQKDWRTEHNNDLLLRSLARSPLIVVVRATREIEMIAYFAARGGMDGRGRGRDEPEEQSAREEGTKHKEGLDIFWATGRSTQAPRFNA